MEVRNMNITVNEQVIGKSSRNTSALPQPHVAEAKESTKTEPSTSVSLSEEGKEKSKQAQEQDYFASLRGGEVGATPEEESSGDKLDDKIKELKDKIATLQQELAQKQNAGDDEDKVKQIESELAVLQAQLMSLLNEKLQGKSTS